MSFYKNKNSTKNFFKLKKAMCKNGHVNYCLKKKIHENEQKIREMSVKIDALTDSNNLKLDYILYMSSELKAPLNTIMGFSSLLGEQEYPKDKQEQFVKNISNASKQILLFSNQTFDMIRFEKENIEPSYFEFCPCEIIKEILEILGEIAEQKNISINFLENDLHIIADKLLFKKVVFNLINNAIKYNKSGGTIEISTSFIYKSFKFKVTDTGRGIPRNLQDKIFKLFVKDFSHPNQPDTLSGIGLAYCKKIIDAQGGKIDFVSKEKKGTSFWFTLPLVPEHLKDRYKICQKKISNK